MEYKAYEGFEGLIFDMDGTILDTEPTHRKAWHQVLSKYNLQFDVAAMVALNGSPTWRIAKFIIDSNQVEMDPHLLAAEKTQAVQAMLLDTVKPLPLIDVVKAFHGRRPMAVGTGSEHGMADALLRHLGLRDCFDVIVGANDVENHKPAPDTFLRCAELLGVPPEKCVVFEDADFGIEAAQRANMAFVDVRRL
ncbi:MAG: fructose-1-phosphate/6-phosphogluconate phosphatase [Rouxiella aceris]|uniref:fructose-1-phosphate/6-phosphogluconate phosphatase n=1 Tax=Rouxiella aceris TaxID=2703884 RepID=UPI00283F6873|nr:fructose-1-phosphate/6-phosphogluconate phosphatase [Rouxiella aceris]MDR3430402.1 fructose-1-phosphate/6-phosphogluconate phosphatase [Rouxiella aceris]